MNRKPEVSPAVLCRALRRALQEIQQIRHLYTISYILDYGRVMFDGKDITDELKREQRDYKAALKALKGKRK
jgi:hypothetical protein